MAVTLPVSIRALPMLAADCAQLDSWPAGRESGLWSSEAVRETLKADSGSGLKIVDGRQLAAYIVGWSVGSSFEIGMLATHPAYRRRGFASALLAAAIRISATVNEVFLELREDNEAALKLYTKMGFNVCGKRPNYYSDGCPALLMRWSKKEF
jgi:ribosomal protein S18 acetylase RimI-like enzyme